MVKLVAPSLECVEVVSYGRVAVMVAAVGDNLVFHLSNFFSNRLLLGWIQGA